MTGVTGVTGDGGRETGDRDDVGYGGKCTLEA